MLPYFTMFQETICECPVKKEQFLLLGADQGRKMHAAGLLGQRKCKMADEDSHSTDSSVSDDEGHSDPPTILLAHNRIFTRSIFLY